MKIAIDLNDVIRDFSMNFLKYYCEGYNHEYDVDTFELWSNDMRAVFPFKNDRSYQKFVYEDFPFEIFGKCETSDKNIVNSLNSWIEEIKDIDTEENIDIMFVSTMEYGASIGYSYFFISKLGPKIREVYFPEDSFTIWDKCDVLITANPNLIQNKPKGKKSVKIAAEYNNGVDGDYNFFSFTSFAKDINNTIKLLENGICSKEEQ